MVCREAAQAALHRHGREVPHHPHKRLCLGTLLGQHVQQPLARQGRRLQQLACILGLGEGLTQRQVAKDDQVVLRVLGGECHTHAVALDALGQGIGEITRLGREGDATATEVRRLARGHARTPGALLPACLLCAEHHLGPRLGARQARPDGGAVPHNHPLKDVHTDGAAEEGGVQSNPAVLVEEDIDSGSLKLFKGLPLEGGGQGRRGCSSEGAHAHARERVKASRGDTEHAA
mmetsp:Transcript_22220/g.55727  ORF Transcript_22220/g.55727 Transcript_22220/m.55727 type:complete len:233 (+) Transcript_22220:295-993(+)